jgi:chromosomal replication initiator protein
MQEVVMEDSQVAAAFSARLAQRIGAGSFELWFHTQTELRAEGDCLFVRAASTLVRNWLRKRFGDDIRAAWQEVVGEAGTLEFELSETSGLPKSTVGPMQATNGIGQPHQPNVGPLAKVKAVPKEPPGGSSAPLRNVADLGTFIVGATNEYAFRAAELTGRGRQQASPLLLCGPTGVGKTHLLKAVLREYRRHHARATAVYLSAEQFTTGFVEAVRGSGLPSFRQKCRGAQLLAIDDLQFFAGKQRTLEELLHTFDTMTHEGRQLVLASDRGLCELRALGHELVSRLAGGLICEIEPPEFNTRLGILRQLRDEASLAIDDSILAYIAQHITAGARELRGAMNRLEAMSEAFNEPITRELAERAVADLARHNTRAVRLADIEKAVCNEFGIEPAQLRSERKGRALSEPRMLAMWLARKYTRAPWSEIGQYFGRRSHSTVISAHRRVEKLISSRSHIDVADRTCNVEDAIRRLETAIKTA